MGQVRATSSLEIAAPAETVFTAITDYEKVRPTILPEQYHDYRVLAGGVGDGTKAAWTLQATKSRSRNVVATVSVAGRTVTERDENSTLVTVYEVADAGAGSRITVTTTWQGAGGVKGFFEKTFAPLGLAKIQTALLNDLAAKVAAA